MRFLVPFVIFATAVAIFFIAADPLYTSTKELKVRITALEKAIVESQETLKLRETLFQKFNAITPEDLKRLGKMLPPSIDNVRLILQVSQLAAEHSLALKKVDVLVPLAITNESNVDETLYNSIGLKFGLTGKYESMRDFLSALEKSLRITDVVLLGFHVDPVQQLTDFDVAVRIYWLKK